MAGVNFGKLGFLAEVEADEVSAALPRLLAADYWSEERALLAITHRRAAAVVGEYLAVNEALISRGRANRVVRLQLWIHGEYVTTYAADGLILATPTGSTGSNLANLGPVLPPDMRALIVSPVLPFVSFPNPLIVPEGAPLPSTRRLRSRGGARHRRAAHDSAAKRGCHRGNHCALSVLAGPVARPLLLLPGAGAGLATRSAAPSDAGGQLADG